MADEILKNPTSEIIQVDAELIDNISDLIDDNNKQAIITLLADIHSADVAEIINHLNYKDAEYIFLILDHDTAGEVITELDENLREKLLQEIEAEKIIDIIEDLDTDDITDVLSDLPDEVADHVLKNIDPEDSKDVKELLKYPEDSAGGIMNADFVAVREGATIADAIAEVRKYTDEIDHVYHVYLLKPNDEMLGYVKLTSLIINPQETSLDSILEEDIFHVHPEQDQEEVANIMERYDLVAIPVLDRDNKMLGRITFDDMIDVIQEEAEEDISRIAGLSEEQETSDSVFRISRIRLPWLFIALAVEFISAAVLHNFQDVISKFVVASFFIPVIMAMGGSAGNQAAIVMVRGLTGSDLWLADGLKRIGKEFFVAALNGLACSVALVLITWLFFSEQVSLEFTMLLSLILLIIIILATIIGASVPVFLKRFGADPAVATGPFVSTMNDVLGLTIYFTLISLFLIN